ncbi:class I SAM-dependent methyltransferase [Alcanivorax sp. 24]|uniref:class I SAM-dependent methyltransferase n=1 Tax=Alcanivorax sp. 24 TaxID=2545266 RepID=UPI00105D05C1|nr:class I SAM-dependent methyltransferase [Alcanivorax sp. 24]
MGFYSDYIFPPLLDLGTRPFHRDRQRLIAAARGRVLEIGVGNGANLPFYSDQATEIHGLEPSLPLLNRARRQADNGRHPERILLLAGDARRLPYPDQHFDTVVACLVLCTIPDPELAAREMRRVMSDTGQLLVLEHIASPNSRTQRWQNRLTPLWKHLACGCHLNRATPDILRDAGFDLTQTHRYRHAGLPAFASQVLEGPARPRPG